MIQEHTPTMWYHEAGGEHCPHGPAPDRDDPRADAWWDRHTGSDQDVYICLDAPMGEGCKTCSDEQGEPVPCQLRTRGPETAGAGHETVTVLVGTPECLDRECEEYFTDDGDEIPGMAECSHIREEAACLCQRGEDNEYTGPLCEVRAA